MKILRRLKQGAFYAAWGGAGFVTVGCISSDAFRRGTHFWLIMGPIVVHYKYVDFKTRSGAFEDRNDQFEKLYGKYASRVLDLIFALQGLYIKFGQYGSARPDIVPKAYVNVFRKLQDGIPPENFPYIEELVNQELGTQKLSDTFSSFEATPLGAASIGQAHRATLNDGTEVVVKVQYPQVEKTFRSDLWIIKGFLSVAIPSMRDAFVEVEAQFATEFDYALEAKNLEEIREGVLPEWEHLVDIPRPIHSLCTKLILTMTFLPGKKLEEALFAAYGRDYQEKLREKFKQNAYRIPSQTELLLYRTYKSFLYHCHFIIASIARFCFLPIDFPSPQVPNPGELLNILLDIHAYETFQVGKVNGDPHPGNILLMPDGRLGLIDYGQVKRLSLEERTLMANLIVSLANEDQESTASTFRKMGFRTDNNDSYLIYKYATIMFDRLDSTVSEGKDMAEFMDDLWQRDRVREFAGSYYLISRISAMMRGLGFALGYNVSLAKKWKPRAAEFLKQHS